MLEFASVTMIIIGWISAFFITTLICIGFNKKTLGALVGILILVAGVYYIPAIQELVKTITIAEVGLAIVAYIVIGVVISLTKWVFFLLKSKQKYKKCFDEIVSTYESELNKFLDSNKNKKASEFNWGLGSPLSISYIKSNALQLYKDSGLYTLSFEKNSDGFYFRDYKSEEELTKVYNKHGEMIPPSYKDHFGEISWNAAFWWIVVLEAISFKFVRKIINLVLNSFSKVFNLISATIFKDINKIDISK
jgi:hypothetical protein